MGKQKLKKVQSGLPTPRIYQNQPLRLTGLPLVWKRKLLLPFMLALTSVMSYGLMGSALGRGQSEVPRRPGFTRPTKLLLPLGTTFWWLAYDNSASCHRWPSNPPPRDFSVLRT